MQYDGSATAYLHKTGAGHWIGQRHPDLVPSLCKWFNPPWRLLVETLKDVVNSMKLQWLAELHHKIGIAYASIPVATQEDVTMNALYSKVFEGWWFPVWALKQPRNLVIFQFRLL